MTVLCRHEADVDLHSSHGIRRRIEAEFRDMPGLRLTLPQAARLFGLEPAHCEHLMLALVRSRLLTTDGRWFARADAGRRRV